MDERQFKIASRSWAITVLITYIYLLVEITYKYSTTKDISACTWEIVLLIVMTVVMWISQRKDEAVSLPRTISGKEVSTELNSQGKHSRLKYYFIDSFVFSVSMIIISVIFYLFANIPLGFYFKISEVSEGFNLFICTVIEFTILFLVSFMFNYIWIEYKVKKYNKAIQKLEDE